MVMRDGYERERAYVHHILLSMHPYLQSHTHHNY